MDKLQYFILTDEEGRTISIVKALSSNVFSEKVRLACKEHFMVDEVNFSPLLIRDYNGIGENKTVTIECEIDNEMSLFYDIRIESVVCY